MDELALTLHAMAREFAASPNQDAWFGFFYVALSLALLLGWLVPRRPRIIVRNAALEPRMRQVMRPARRRGRLRVNEYGEIEER